MQKVFVIVDELATILASMHGTFEGNAKDEPTTIVVETLVEDDEDHGVDVIGFQEVWYPRTHSMTCCNNVVDAH